MNLREIQSNLESNIHEISVQLENLHRTLASEAFNRLGSIEQIRGQIDSARLAHDETVTRIYSLVRDLNAKGGESLRDLIQKTEK